MEPEDPAAESTDRGATLAPTATTLNFGGDHLSSDLDDSFLRQVAGSTGAGSSAELVPPELGTVIDGKYLLESLCGRGGMGLVFGARHLASDRPVALKWMQRRGDVGELRQRFIGEARAAGRIRHPNVVDVFDVVATDDLTYLVMELLEGESLRKRLRRSCLSHAEAVDLGIGLLSGLEEAHRRGVIHRDLKPENVFLCSEPAGRVKIVDFGISVIERADSALGSQLTRAGQFVGTPSYTALERLRDNQKFDHRVDLYSVGVILYEALCGSLPFEAMSVSELTFQLATREPTPLHAYLPAASSSLVRVVHRALQRNPDERFADARSFREALVATLNAEVPVQSNRLASRSAVAAAILAGIGVAGFAWTGGGGEPSVRIAKATPPPVREVSSDSSAAARAPASSAAVASFMAAPANSVSADHRVRTQAAERKRTPLPARPGALQSPPPEAEVQQSANVTLRVVVFPYGDVWIDGRHVGTSPARVNVAAGAHRIAGGRSRPERERSIDVRSGETRDVVLSWRDAESDPPAEADAVTPRSVQSAERAAEVEGAAVRTP